jgi:hypothetical protein
MIILRLQKRHLKRTKNLVQKNKSYNINNKKINIEEEYNLSVNAEV